MNRKTTYLSSMVKYYMLLQTEIDFIFRKECFQIGLYDICF